MQWNRHSPAIAITNNHTPSGISCSSALRRIMLTLACCAGLLCMQPLRAQQQNTLTAKGLQAPVEILRDQWGVNHIYAANQHDLFFAQGYAAAKDRLFQFEIWRRQATGTVAEILGPSALTRDIGSRLFRFRGNMKKELSHYHPEGKEIINAFVNGVNAYIDEAVKNPESLPLEFRLLHMLPEKWTPEIVVSRHQGIIHNVAQELRIGQAVAKAGDSLVKDLMWFHPKDPLLKLDSAIRGDLLSNKILELYTAYRQPITFDRHMQDLSESEQKIIQSSLSLAGAPDEHAPEMEGSNNWVVSGSRTASGHAMMASDPHRKIAVPSLRYIAHLSAPGWNVIGGGEPVLPGISLGHNEYGAWGLTIYETDSEDLYVYDLHPTDLKKYRHKGKWKSMKEIRETIPVKDNKNIDVTLRYTLHGPVTFIDTANRKAYAVKCGWLEPGGAPYLASLRMDQAESWEAFREACSYSHLPGLNMVWADKSGDIGWQTVGIIPIRKNFSGLVPVPGDGRYEWGKYMPIRERPHLLNPAKGFFATANQHVTPDNYTHWDAIGFTWSDAFRGNRINEALNADNKMTIEKMGALQADYLSIPARTLTPMLKGLEFSGLAFQAREQLKDWDFTLDKNSVAAGIYVMWERELIKNMQERFIPESLKGLVNLHLTKYIQWLQSPGDKFGANAIAERNAFLKASFEAAVLKLEKKLGSDIANWKYGQEKYKHVYLAHELSAIAGKEIKEQLNIGPIPRGGNSYTVGVTGAADNQTSGASLRMVFDTGDWDQGIIINTPGQSADPSSPYYKSLFETWANDQYFPAYFSKEKINSVTAERLLLEPKK